MKKLIFLFLLLLISCFDGKGEVDEFFKDYFPLKVGYRWVYKLTNGGEVVREVILDTLFGGTLREVKVEMMGELEDYLKGEDAVFLKYSSKDIVENQEVVLEESVLPLIYQPVLKDEIYKDSLTRFLNLGDTLKYTRRYQLEVKKLSSGRVKLSYAINSEALYGAVRKENNLSVFYELAPDTGPVFIKKVSNGDTLFLTLKEFFRDN